MRRSLGEGWRFGRRVFRGFVAVEAVPAYSKRTEGHGGIELDAIRRVRRYQSDELWSSRA
jgi:hypothetical protein